MTGLQIEKLLKRHKVAKVDVARLAGVSWQMVWLVCRDQRWSGRVAAAIEKLTGTPVEKSSRNVHKRSYP